MVGFYAGGEGITVSTVTFDTLKFVKKLEAGGFERTQAEGIVVAFRDAFAERQLMRERQLKIDTAKANANFAILNWMMGLSVCGIVILVLRAFF